MTISCKNGKAYVDVGGYETWKALSSTVQVRLKDVHNQIPYALSLLSGEKCSKEHCFLAAKQFNIVRDELSKYAPDQMVFDSMDITKSAPWGDNISPVITSCGNYFSSADGRDLLAEIVRVLTVAAYLKTDVVVQ